MRLEQTVLLQKSMEARSTTVLQITATMSISAHHQGNNAALLQYYSMHGMTSDYEVVSLSGSYVQVGTVGRGCVPDMAE